MNIVVYHEYSCIFVNFNDVYPCLAVTFRPSHHENFRSMVFTSRVTRRLCEFRKLVFADSFAMLYTRIVFKCDAVSS